MDVKFVKVENSRENFVDGIYNSRSGSFKSKLIKNVPVLNITYNLDGQGFIIQCRNLDLKNKNPKVYNKIADILTDNKELKNRVKAALEYGDSGDNSDLDLFLFFRDNLRKVCLGESSD